MKLIGASFLLLIPIFLVAQKVPPKIIRLPLTFAPGYGAFAASLKPISFEDSTGGSAWGKTYFTVQGIPVNWKKIKKGVIWLNPYQFAYQNFLAGNISQEFFKGVQESWQWKPDKKKLSANPIKCYLNAVSGEDEQGNKLVKVDANNNLDFSDDSTFTPAAYETGVNMDSLSKKNALSIKYEMLYKGKVVERKIPLLVLSYNNSCWYNYPQYAVASFITGSQNQKIAVSSGEPDFLHSGIILITDTLLTKKANPDLMIMRDEYVLINNKVYKNKDVDISEAVLQLEAVPIEYEKLYSTQVNFKAIPFQGKEFTSHEVLSMNKYKGKFLLIDFWGTWCNPCLRELPNLRKVYDSLDRSKIEILGIVGEDDAASLKEFLEKEKIPWSQILSDDVNKIVENYRIEEYPTSFLLNPQGVIVAKNLRGNNLYARIAELMGD